MRALLARRRRRELLSLGVFVIAFAPVYLLARILTAALSAARWHKWLPYLHALCGIRRRVLYLEVFYPGSSGYTYRVAKWLPVLESAGFRPRVRYPLPGRVMHGLLDGGWVGIFYAAYMLRRVAQCLTAPFYNCVVVRRELLLFNDYGDLFLEKLLLALNPQVILDFDDDIAAAKQEPRSLSRVGRLLRESPHKFSDCLDLYPRFMAGSSYLREMVLARRPSRPPTDIEVIPTCVDYVDLESKHYEEQSGPVTLGWIGTNGNLPELERIVPQLEAVAGDTAIRLVVISGKDLAVSASFPVENRRWSLESQLSDLLDVDIGLMPLQDSREARGKCGFKLIQYMGLGLVGMASAITTNREIISADGVDGFLVEPGESWEPALRRAISQRERFGEIGARGRARIRDHYSVAANGPRYVACIDRAITP